MTLALAPPVLAIADGVLTRRTLDGVLLLHLDGGDPVLLSGPGAMLWSVLEIGPAQWEALVATMAAEYGVDSSLVAADLEGVVDELLTLGLVQRGVQPIQPRSSTSGG